MLCRKFLYVAYSTAGVRRPRAVGRGQGRNERRGLQRQKFESRSYLSGYFIIRRSKVRVPRSSGGEFTGERAALGYGLLGGNRQVPPSCGTFEYIVPREYSIWIQVHHLVRSRYLCPSTNGSSTLLGCPSNHSRYIGS